MDKRLFKKLLLLIAFAVLLIFLMINFKDVWSILMMILAVFTPFLVGFLIAFIVNIPAKFFYNKVYKRLEKKGSFLSKCRRPLSIITAYLIFAGIIVFAISVLVPELIKSIDNLINNMSGYTSTFESNVNWFLKEYFNYEITSNNDFLELLDESSKWLTGKDSSSLLVEILQIIAPNIFSLVQSVWFVMYNFFVGAIVSIYYLVNKDKMTMQLKKAINAYLPQKAVNKLVEIGTTSNRICSKYVSGVILDAAIIGVLCFIGMSILGMEYSLLISFLIATTNLIPILGPFLGAVPSIFLLLVINPWHALWFTIFIICLQQLDANFITPRIIGNTMGLSGFWVMASIIVAGAFFGVFGMLIAVPVFSVIYALLGKDINKKLEQKGKLDEFTEKKVEVVKEPSKK